MRDVVESPIPSVARISPVCEGAPDEHAKSDSASRTVCDLAQAQAFDELYSKPHVPVAVAFGGERLHACRLLGPVDLDKAVAENAGALFRSIRKLSSRDCLEEWDDLTFRFGSRAFVYADKNLIVGYASTPAEAERLVAGFRKAYLKPSAPAGGEFHLIQQDRYDIRSHAVTLPPDTVLTAEALDLHYGSDFEEWHRDFSGKLRARNHGLSIFEGSPGTGKTSYLRHLMGVLKESHRFYFIPNSTLGILTSRDFISFWAEQRRTHCDRIFVVILEDSDAALMTRGSDNREQVSAILNLSDGMLGDFLRLHILCTINCSSADIDPALLRPGRLLCHRTFRRLEYPEAVRLAGSLGRELPSRREYSLAEVFAGQTVETLTRPRVGFAV
jgi:hypothetical protein